jgi:hypothetical protein
VQPFATGRAATLTYSLDQLIMDIFIIIITYCNAVIRTNLCKNLSKCIMNQSQSRIIIVRSIIKMIMNLVLNVTINMTMKINVNQDSNICPKEKHHRYFLVQHLTRCSAQNRFNYREPNLNFIVKNIKNIVTHSIIQNFVTILMNDIVNAIRKRICYYYIASMVNTAVMIGIKNRVVNILSPAS